MNTIKIGNVVWFSEQQEVSADLLKLGAAYTNAAESLGWPANPVGLNLHYAQNNLSYLAREWEEYGCLERVFCPFEFTTFPGKELVIFRPFQTAYRGPDRMTAEVRELLCLAGRELPAVDDFWQYPPEEEPEVPRPSHPNKNRGHEMPWRFPRTVCWKPPHKEEEYFRELG